jgi:ketosteroid isomerase-like protein
MKPLFILLALLATVATQDSAKLGVNARIEQELRQLEREWDGAIVRKDTATLDRILSDDFVYIDSVGGINPKADIIQGLKNSEAVIEPFETEDVVVRVYGNTAILTGRFTQKATYKGQTFTGQFRYTDVYVKRENRWQAVSAHASRIPEKK